MYRFSSRSSRHAKTVLEIFHDILSKEKLDKRDIGLIVDRIIVYENRIEIKLRDDVDALLRCDDEAQTEEIANFNGDTENIERTAEKYNSVVVQSAKNQADKVFRVNVINGGDPLEIYTDREGEVIFKKYSPIGELSAFAGQYAETLHKTCGLCVAICDRDSVIACAGIPRKEYSDKALSEALEGILEGRSLYHYAEGQEPVNGGTQLRLVAGAVLFRLMLNVALALVPAGNDDGQAMFFADPVTGAADEVIAPLIGVIEERFTRLKTLGADYAEEALTARIAGRPRPSRQPQQRTGKPSLLIDIQNNLKAQQSAGYKHWATIENLKRAAETLNFLTEHGISSYEELTERCNVPLRFGLPRLFQQGLHILAEGVVLPFLPLGFSIFRLQGGLPGGEFIHFGPEPLGGGQGYGVQPFQFPCRRLKPMTRTEAIKEFFKKAVLPVAIAGLLYCIFKSACIRNGELDLLWLWILCGLPFGIHRMCVWIVPGGSSLGGGAALFALNFIIGGLIGGFVLVWRLLVAAWYVPLTIYRLIVG